LSDDGDRVGSGHSVLEYRSIRVGDGVIGGEGLRRPSRDLDIRDEESFRNAAVTLLGTAMDTLYEVMTDPDAAPGARLSAVNTVLDRALGKPEQGVQNQTNVQINVNDMPPDELAKALVFMGRVLDGAEGE